jgi:hypothetical protein
MNQLFLLILLISNLLSANEKIWEPTHFVWGFGLTLECDVTEKNKETPWNADVIYKDIKNGDIVWVPGEALDLFQKDVLPKITEPFILLINQSDRSFPTFFNPSFDVINFINDSRIIHIFAQNCDLESPHAKVTPIPIGIDFHTLAYEWRKPRNEFISIEDQEKKLHAIISLLKPTSMRKSKAFVDFQHHDTMKISINQYEEDRTSIFHKILPSGVIDFSTKRIPRDDLWKTKGEYAFSISPHGNGLDCHRTWEDLALGCIVIVKTSPLDCLYEDLPVVIVKDWSEVSKENFEIWKTLYADAFTNPIYREKLTHKYWMNKIKAKQTEYKNSI